MDQRPGQNVDLALYFHREGSVFPKIRLKKLFLTEKIRNFPKKYLRVPLSLTWTICFDPFVGSMLAL